MWNEKLDKLEPDTRTKPTCINKTILQHSATTCDLPQFPAPLGI